MSPTNLTDDDENDSGVLPESISIARIDDLLAQMRFHEAPKRALFNVPFELAPDFVIGVKGCVISTRSSPAFTQAIHRYGLVTEQKKGSYKYFTDQEDRMELVEPRTVYRIRVSARRAEPKSFGIKLLTGPIGW